MHASLGEYCKGFRNTDLQRIEMGQNTAVFARKKRVATMKERIKSIR